MPLVSKAFGDIITFTRASTGTFFDSAGVLQSAAIDAPRFDYNPATLAAQGLLIEEQRTNSLPRSEEFNNATWSKTGSTVTANATTAPTNTTVADKLVEDTSTGGHLCVAEITGAPDNTIYTSSCFCKASERNWVAVSVADKAGAINRVWFNLSTGAQGTTNGTVTAFSAVNVGNGWYRLAVSASSVTGASNVQIRISIGTADNTAAYTGDGTSGLFLWGAQLEAGAFPTSYIPTTTTALTRSADVASVNTLSPWFNATEGTLFAEWTAQTFTHRPATFNDGTQNNAIALVALATNIGSNVYVSNVFQGTAGVSGTFTTGTTYKQATAYKLNDTQDFANGVAATTDTTISIPTVTQLLLGAGRNGMASTPGNGWLRRFTYYPRRLSQAEGIAITA